MSKRKVIIDCDPGIDDAFAIVAAINEPGFEVLGVHTVSGNVSVEHTTRNTQGLLYALNSNVPIYRGAHRPLAVDPIYAGDVHGHNGFSGFQFTDDQLNPISELTSLQGYYQTLSTIHEPITIIAIGPLTNVALLIKSYPELIDKIECLSIMGGGLKGGNITVAGEFNFYADPHAAKIVFESKIPIIMAGLDVTERAYFKEEDVLYCKENFGIIGEILYQISKPGLARSESYEIGRNLLPNDVVSVLALSDEQLFVHEPHEIHILTEGEGRGMTVANTRIRDQIKPNARVLKEVDVDQFRKTLINKIGGTK